MPGFFFSIATRQKDESLSAATIVGSPAVVAPATNSTPKEEILPSDTLAAEELLLPTPAPEKEIETVRLGKGETLRILAEKLFGNREFWVYIYLENKHIIADPNRVPAGISLLVPDTRQYGIDAADPASVQSAKQQGDSLFQS
ncbi:MAG TPA: hypothetical protein PLS06_05265 [Proteiniphilum sp.]|nr:hypothetical protein [Proteiniphilum sp.]